VQSGIPTELAAYRARKHVTRSNATQLQWSCWTFSSRNRTEYIVFVALKILRNFYCTIFILRSYL